MPVFTVTSARPRQELALAIVEGEGSIDGLIGEKILPPMPVNRRTAHLIKATIADTQGLRIIASNKWIHAPGTKFERIVAKLGDDTLTVTLRGVEIVVPNEVQMDWEGYADVEAFYASRFGRETSGLTKEYLIAAAIFNTNNFTSTNSSVAYTAALKTTFDPIGDIIAAIRRLRAKGEVPDTVVIPGVVFERIRFGSLVLAYIAGTLRPGMDVTANTFQMALAEYGIKQVLIGDSYYNSAADGATPVLTAIWSTTYIWVGKAGRTGATQSADADGIGVPQLAGVGADIYWEGYVPGGVPSVDREVTNFAGGNYVESYPDISIDSMVVRLKMSNQPYVGNTRAGELIATQWS